MSPLEGFTLVLFHSGGLGFESRSVDCAFFTTVHPVTLDSIHVVNLFVFSNTRCKPALDTL